MHKIKIKKATLKDVPEIVKMAKEISDYHKGMNPNFIHYNNESPRIFSKWCKKSISDKKSFVLIAETENKAVGYLIAKEKELPEVYKKRKNAHIHDLFVKENFRGKNLGKKLINEAEKLFRKKKYLFYSLKVNYPNTKGHNFYKKMKLQNLHIEMVKKI